MSTRAIALAAVTVLIGALALTGCGRDPAALHGSDQVGVTVLPVDQRVPMPEVAGTTIDGEQMTLSQLRGMPVVLNAWASWCEPCRAELPLLAEAARKYDGKVRFLGIDVTDESAAAKELVAKTGITYPSLVDTDGAILASLPGVPPKAVPSTLILDSQGRIAVRVIGDIAADEIDDLIAKAG